MPPKEDAKDNKKKTEDPENKGPPKEEKPREEAPLPKDENGNIITDEKDLKKVYRPDKQEFEKEVDKLNDEVKSLNDKLAVVDRNIAVAKASGGGQTPEVQEARTQMKQLKEVKDKVWKEKQELFDARNAAKESLDTKITAGRAQRAELKYTSLEDIVKQIEKLETQQHTTSMTLAAEKKLLKEIEALKQSKKAVAHLAGQSDAITAERKASQTINEQLSTKSAELEGINKQIDAQRAILDAANSQNSEKKSVLPGLFKEKECLRKERQEKIDTVKTLRSEFRSVENEFRAYVRDLRRIRDGARKIQDEEQKKVREERKKAFEEEEAKRVPYEEEMALCDYLVSHLESKYVAKEATPEAAAAPAVATPLSGGDFEGMVCGGKKAVEEEEFFTLGGKTKGKGKKKGGAKQVLGGDGATIRLDMDSLNNFASLSLTAPATADKVGEVIEALKAKKVYFSTLPRGQVKSMREKSQEEREAARSKDSNDRPIRDSDRDIMPAEPPKKELKKKVENKKYDAADMSSFPSLAGAPSKPKEADAKADK